MLFLNYKGRPNGWLKHDGAVLHFVFPKAAKTEDIYSIFTAADISRELIYINWINDTSAFLTVEKMSTETVMTALACPVGWKIRSHAAYDEEKRRQITVSFSSSSTSPKTAEKDCSSGGPGGGCIIV